MTNGNGWRSLVKRRDELRRLVAEDEGRLDLALERLVSSSERAPRRWIHRHAPALLGAGFALGVWLGLRGSTN